LYNPPPIKVIPKELDEQEKREIKRNCYEKARNAYRQALKNKPILKRG